VLIRLGLEVGTWEREGEEERTKSFSPPPSIAPLLTLSRLLLLVPVRLSAMAITFKDFSTAEGLQQLDEFVSSRVFISGHQGSLDDLAVFGALSTAPGTDFPHASSWYSKVSHSLGSRFPGEGVGVHIGVGGSAVAGPEVPEVAQLLPVTAAEEKEKEKEKEEDDDDDLDLFGEETEEEKAAAAQREAAKKASGKKAVVGKSSVLMDVKPWDDETDMKKLEEHVRGIQMDGLFWGASKLVPVGYGIKKLQIMMTIEDDKVSPDNLIEDYLSVEPASDYIQSCDIVAFNKI
jgi:elongation factor 1-beta